MENRYLKENNTLLITAYCFNILLKAVLDHFIKTHNHPSSSKVTQLYGFGNYNSKQPNLKQELERLTGAFINGKQEKAKQLELISSSQPEQTYYYVSYHFGEYKDALHIRTKTLMDGRMVEGGESILYIGYGDPSRSAFILGVFSAFDINNRVIAGKTIHEKCASKEEMILKSRARKIPAYIAQEIRNVRIENDAIIPNDKLEISPNSPYSITYDKLPGQYNFNLLQKDKIIGDFSFQIDKDTFRITPLTSGVLINRDHFEILQNGSVIHFSFKLTGIALFSRLEVFFKTYYLNKAPFIPEPIY